MSSLKFRADFGWLPANVLNNNAGDGVWYAYMCFRSSDTSAHTSSNKVNSGYVWVGKFKS